MPKVTSFYIGFCSVLFCSKVCWHILWVYWNHLTLVGRSLVISHKWALINCLINVCKCVQIKALGSRFQQEQTINVKSWNQSVWYWAKMTHSQLLETLLSTFFVLLFIYCCFTWSRSHGQHFLFHLVFCLLWEVCSSAVNRKDRSQWWNVKSGAQKQSETQRNKGLELSITSCFTDWRTIKEMSEKNNKIRNEIVKNEQTCGSKGVITKYLWKVNKMK